MRVVSAARAGRIAIWLKEWTTAKRWAEICLENSRKLDLRVFELDGLLILRAAERGVGNHAAAGALTAQIVNTARALGFDPPEKLGGRADLLALWRLGEPGGK